MIIDRIGTDKSYEMVGPYGLKIWDKKSVSGTITPGEDIQQAYKELDNILEAAHAETLTQMEEFRGTKVVDVPAEPKDQLSSFVEAITTCTTMKALQTFEKLVQRENKDELYEAYTQTKKRLENEQH